jgi:hypothetical protein
MKRITLVLIFMFCTATVADDFTGGGDNRRAGMPRIAVYVTGDVPDNERKALGTRILSALVNSGRYMGIERSNSFLAEVEKEQERQRSGAIDDEQISELGRQFGVKYVCIADITPAFGSYQLSARIVDVETAVVISIGESFSALKSANDLTEVSNAVVNKMLGIQEAPEKKADPPAVEPPPPPITQQAEPSKKPLKSTFFIGLSVEMLGAGIAAYGLAENGKASKLLDENRFSKAEKSAKNRNVAYIVGAAVLLSGISIQIFF